MLQSEILETGTLKTIPLMVTAAVQTADPTGLTAWQTYSPVYSGLVSVIVSSVTFSSNVITSSGEGLNETNVEVNDKPQLCS